VALGLISFWYLKLFDFRDLTGIATAVFRPKHRKEREQRASERAKGELGEDCGVRASKPRASHAPALSWESRPTLRL
jgi:hypothetical protein